MNNLAKKLNFQSNDLGYAVIKSKKYGEYILEGDGGIFKARVSFDCLIEPEKKDRVLFL